MAQAHGAFPWDMHLVHGKASASRAWGSGCVKSLDQGNSCNSRLDGEVQRASGSVALGQHGRLVRGLFPDRRESGIP